MSKKKLLLIIIGILVISLVVFGATFAYLSWISDSSQETMVTFTATPEFTCSADAGGSISSEGVTLAPTDCNDSDHVIKKVITTNVTNAADNVSVDMSLKLVADYWGRGTAGNSLSLWYSDNFKYALTKDANSCKNNVISSGTFQYTNYVQLLNNVTYVGTQNDTYYLYIWLDKDETNTQYMNASYTGHIEGSCIATSFNQNAFLVDLSASDAYFKESAYKTKITSVDFVDYIDTTGATKTYDLGINPEKPVTGWLIKNNGVNTYKLYIGSEEQIYATNMNQMFSGMSALVSINFANLNTAFVTDMSSTFNNCTSLSSITFGNNFDTSNVTTMAYMFLNCNSLSSIDLSGFNTSKVTNMSQMFDGFGSTSLDVSSFDTGNVTGMSMMFANNANLSSITFGNNFDTSKVTTMNSMFTRDTSLTSLDLSFFDTSSLNSTLGMFGYNTNLTSLDLSGWNTSNLSTAAMMFAFDTNLTTIYVSELWNLSNLSTTGYGSNAMFKDCTSLPNFNSSVIDKTNAHYNTGGYLTYKAAPNNNS